MATLYITSTANTGTGTLRELIENAANGDVIQPDPILFPKGTLCNITLSSSLRIEKSIILQGCQTRIVLAIYGYLFFGKDSSFSPTLNDITFSKVDIRSATSSSQILSYSAKTLNFSQCSICGIGGDSQRAAFVIYDRQFSSGIFQDCAFYGNMSGNSGGNSGCFYFPSSTLAAKFTFINCTFGANIRYKSTDRINFSYSTYPTKINVVATTGTQRETGWRIPPDSTYAVQAGNSTWTRTSYQSMDPHPSSSASWRTGAVATDSTVDLDGNPRKTNGALGAYEYYVGKLTAPTSLSSSNITSDGFTLAWSNVENADSYKVIVNEITTVVSTNQATITGLSPVTTYTVEVIACDSLGRYLDSDAATIDVTTEKGYLATPTGLTSSSVTSSSATISWTAVTNATSYQITYTPSGGASTTVTSATNSVALTNLSGATSYSVEVVAVGDGTTYTDSSSSSALSFTTLQKLATPTGLKVTNNAVITTTAKQTITWNTVANATGYKLEYKQSTSITWNSVTRTDATVIFPNRTRNVSYDHRVTALGDGTTYEDSDTSSVVTKKSKQQLATPTGLTCTNKTATSLTFSWNEVSGTKTYNLGYKLPSASSYTYLTPTSSPATITGLTAGTTYQVYISARTPTDSTNYDGSAYTSPVSIATLAPLSAPTGLTHDQVTSTSARVGWNAVTNATDYKVEYRVQGATDWTEDQQ